LESILKVTDLRTYFFTLDGVVKAVEDVSFSLGLGDTLGIVGESGSGKSVTAQSIMRIVPEPSGRIVSGSIMFKGQELISLPEREMGKIRGNKIAMIYQEPMTALNPAFNVGDQVSEVFRVHQRLSKKESLKRSIQLLEQVGIPSPENSARAYPHQLSGGMRQRVVIAMAIACNPDILIADEPTTALDVTVQAQIMDLIVNLKEQLGTSLLLISHDLGVVGNMVNRMIVMYGGNVVESGYVNDIFSNPSHPYTQCLIECIPKIGRRTDMLKEIPGVVPNLLRLPPGCKFANRCPKVMDICRTEEPVLFKVDHDHYSRCWIEKGKSL
jgi:peptide/nickel transport system ATP-binding protein